MNIDVAIKYLQSLPPLERNGGQLRIEFFPPCSLDKIKEFEATFSLLVPEALRDLLLISDGLQIYSEHIISIGGMYLGPDDLLIFHLWGNGDVTAIAVQDSRFRVGEIVFGGHDPPAERRVAINIGEWMVRVANEVRRHGELLHPWDCHSVPDAVYAATRHDH